MYICYANYYYNFFCDCRCCFLWRVYTEKSYKQKAKAPGHEGEGK